MKLTHVNSYRIFNCIEINWILAQELLQMQWLLFSHVLWFLARAMPHTASDTASRAVLCFSEPTASVPPQSDVYRMLHDNRNEPTQPRQSGSFRVLQELVNDGEQPWMEQYRRGEESKHTAEWKIQHWFSSVIPWIFPEEDLNGAWFRKGAPRMYPSSHQPSDKRTPEINSIHSRQGASWAQKS